MIPYIEKAKKEKMGVIVVNPNFTHIKKKIEVSLKINDVFMV